MQGTTKNITVNKKTYKVYSDFIARATYAEDENGNKLTLRTSGYMSSERTIKKTIKMLTA